jgi:hypothetical protein
MSRAVRICRAIARALVVLADDLEQIEHTDPEVTE